MEDLRFVDTSDFAAIPAVVLDNHEEDTSTLGLPAVESDTVLESTLMAEFAEQTAHEMATILEWYQTPENKEPVNSLTNNEDSVEKEGGLPATDGFPVESSPESTLHPSTPLHQQHQDSFREGSLSFGHLRSHSILSPSMTSLSNSSSHGTLHDLRSHYQTILQDACSVQELLERIETLDRLIDVQESELRQIRDLSRHLKKQCRQQAPQRNGLLSFRPTDYFRVAFLLGCRLIDAACLRMKEGLSLEVLNGWIYVSKRSSLSLRLWLIRLCVLLSLLTGVVLYLEYMVLARHVHRLVFWDELHCYE